MDATLPEVPPGRALAVAAEGLYLANLLLMPGLAFVILLTLYLRHRRSAPALARAHLRQTVVASLWAGALLGVANGLIVALGGYAAVSTWVVVVMYFTVCHSTLVCFGAIGLARAMAGQRYRFPLIGPQHD